MSHLRILAILGLFFCGTARAAQPPADAEFFEKRIRPLFADHCYKCHGPEKSKGDLRLDTRQGLRQGGKTGPAVVPGHPEKSLLIEAVRYTNEDLQMPPKEQLTETQVNDLVSWVREGAHDPRGDAPAAAADPIAAARQHWPYTPIASPTPPVVGDKTWPVNPIDQFILARLEENHLSPAPRADQRTLIRRATYDLTGLPPTPAEVEAFVADTSPDAYARLVDRLLASPAYGQRYARYWLDLVRYTDSFDARGTGGPMDCAQAWRYRDYVVDAFNRDLPYDEFVREQIAGDLMEGSGLRVQGSAKTNAESKTGTGTVSSSSLNPLIATTVYAIGNWGGGDADKEKLLTDIVDDQIDLTGRAFLGLTLACARCHDHKFDPIPTADYYGLAGIFFSSHILPDVGPKTNGPNMLTIPLASREELARREKLKAQLAALEKNPQPTEFTRASFVPMHEPARDIHNLAGLVALKPSAKQDVPSATFNTTDKPVSFITIKMPARSVAVHPPPTGGVAAVFESPAAASVTITAHLADADPNCGDGIAYRLLHRTGDSAKILSAGAIDNGKKADLSAGPATLARGDRVELLILPRAEYSCDTTLIDVKLTPTDGGGPTHDLVTETLADPFAANSSWHFDQLVADPRIASLRAQLATPLPTTHGLQEGGVPGSPQAGIHDVKIHIRGRYDRLGALVPRHFPRVLAGDKQAPITQGSGRLQLANWVASPTNPLTARVIANRLWQWHFGEGIVRTPNNFGKLGTAPTHPELLDYLATQLIRNHWSLKSLHRQIMLSATYQQASIRPQPADPDNLLFSRMNRRRLDAEAIRDTMLAITGELDPTPQSGPGFKDLDTPRRTLYMMTVRSDRTGYRMLFDAADPTAIVDKRTDSTVAPQALFVMNHPFVLARAKKLAAEAATPQRGDDRDRVNWLYRRLFARPATENEIALATRFIQNRGATGWSEYCHVLLCSNEFTYVD
jgi:mono/diheme cytochrome c family protein